MFSRILFLTTYCLVVVQVAAVNVRFLGSVARFRNSSRLDYYYICRTCGQTIQWEVNMADGPSHFETDKIGQVRFRADSTGDDINYLSILLLRTNTNNEMCLTALLVVSRLSSEPVSIVCRGDTSQKMAGNNPTSTFLSDKAIEGDVRIDYLFYDDDIISEHTSTYRTFIFICNVNGTSQFWMAGTDSIGGFVLNNDVGLDAIQRNRNDADIAYTVAVLIARQLIQRTLTSILVLLEENYTRNFSVSCRSDTTELSLPVIYSLSRNTDNMGLMSTTMNSINEVSTSLSSFSTSSFTSSTLFDNSERVGISIVGITILSIFMTIFGIIIITVIAVILLFGFKKWRKTIKGPSIEINEDPQVEKETDMSSKEEMI